ncbi:MAG TPA: galactokinase family protein, partial [Candidatus Dormibacteraeota bacterium]|nr:galactokinase family protein [Candidatus Dormibacteraeota bacterium]
MRADLGPAAVAALRRAGGRAPAAAGSAPGRVVIVGEHAGETGGLALPFAIDRATHLPWGAGLGSAAALEVATLVAAARRFTGASSGLMDPVAVIVAESGEALRLDCRLLDARLPVPRLLAAHP